MVSPDNWWTRASIRLRLWAVLCAQAVHWQAWRLRQWVRRWLCCRQEATQTDEDEMDEPSGDGRAVVSKVWCGKFLCAPVRRAMDANAVLYMAWNGALLSLFVGAAMLTLWVSHVREYTLDPYYNLHGPIEYEVEDKFTVRTLFDAAGLEAAGGGTHALPDLFDFVETVTICQRVEEIQVLWYGDTTDMPRPEDFVYHRTHSVVKVVPVTDRTHRFHPVADSPVRTDGLFSTDPRLRITCDDLHFLYNVWLSGQDTVVGLSPRLHDTSTTSAQEATQQQPQQRQQTEPQTEREEKQNRNGAATEAGTVAPPTVASASYLGWAHVAHTGSYSIVLADGAFVHRRYLDSYASETYRPVRDMAAAQPFCDDLAMAYVVAAEAGQAPIWTRIETAFADESRDTGRSGPEARLSQTDTSLQEHRDACLTSLASVSEGPRLPFILSSHKAMRASEAWWW